MVCTLFQQEHSHPWLAPQGWEARATQALPRPGVPGLTPPRFPPPTRVWISRWLSRTPQRTQDLERLRISSSPENITESVSIWAGYSGGLIFQWVRLSFHSQIYHCYIIWYMCNGIPDQMEISLDGQTSLILVVWCQRCPQKVRFLREPSLASFICRVHGQNTTQFGLKGIPDILNSFKYVSSCREIIFCNDFRPVWEHRMVSDIPYKSPQGQVQYVSNLSFYFSMVASQPTFTCHNLAMIVRFLSLSRAIFRSLQDGKIKKKQL